MSETNRKVESSTQEKVLDMSMNLFNQHGIEAVSLSQISQALGISPGNLTYHYHRKADLIASHIARFRQQLEQGVESIRVGASPEIFGSAYLQLLQLTLQYRFLFISANYILHNELVAFDAYERLIEDNKQALIRQFDRLIDAGIVTRPTHPYSLELLVDGIWWQWLGWLLAMQINPPDRRISESEMLIGGALHILFLCHHYIDEDYYVLLREELSRQR